MKRFIIALFALCALASFGDYTPISAETDATITGDWAFEGIVLDTPDTTSLTNGAVFTPVSSVCVLSGIGGANDTTNTITLADAVDGQLLTLVMDAATTNLITIADSGNCALSGAWLGDANDVISLIGVSTNWVETSASDN